MMDTLNTDIKSSSADPNSLEEAKQIISLKNTIVLKLKNYTSSLMNSASFGPGDQQTLIDYLKYENERLESKLLLIQNELGVEKTRAEQMKEVGWVYFSQTATRFRLSLNKNDK